MDLFYVCFAGSNLKGIVSDVGFIVQIENSKLTLVLKHYPVFLNFPQ